MLWLVKVSVHSLPVTGLFLVLTPTQTAIKDKVAPSVILLLSTILTWLLCGNHTGPHPRLSELGLLHLALATWGLSLICVFFAWYIYEGSVNNLLKIWVCELDNLGIINIFNFSFLPMMIEY